ncbi:MAG TPA: hypothetical protein D7H95_00225 [Candidatus Poseidoniales archaeon]|nr:MAG TPA: hypothetical protein D7H95_00225 [Candidatus Poseidoniales archaeon]
MACNEIVNLAAFTLNAFACSGEIKFSGQKDHIGEHFEEFLHCFSAVHVHKRVNHIRGFSYTKVSRSIIHFNAIWH